MNQKVLKTAAFLCAVSFLITGCNKKTSSDEGLPKINVTEFKTEDLSKTLKTEGIVESTEKDSSITTELTTYKVKKINFKLGDSVKPGDVVCELDSTEIENEIAELEKAIQNSDTLYDYRYQQLLNELESTRKTTNLQIEEISENIRKTNDEYNNQKSSYDSNQSDYNRFREEANSIKANAEAAEDPEQAAALMAQYQEKMAQVAAAMSGYETANAQMKALEESKSMLEKNLESARIAAQSQIETVQYKIDTYSLTEGSSSENTKRLEELRENLENTKIKATKEGVISMVAAEEGKPCRDGVIMSLQSNTDMCIHVSISEEDLLSVDEGMKAVITIPATKDQEYEGMVDRVVEIKSPNGFDGYISIEDTKNFRIGMTASVQIKIIDADDALSVNSKAVFQDEEDETKSYVYEAEKQDDDSYKLRKVEVKKGIEKDDIIAITGDGLEEGDYIVLTPAKCSENDIVDIRIGR